MNFQNQGETQQNGNTRYQQVSNAEVPQMEPMDYLLHRYTRKQDLRVCNNLSLEVKNHPTFCCKSSQKNLHKKCLSCCSLKQIYIYIYNVAENGLFKLYIQIFSRFCLLDLFFVFKGSNTFQRFNFSKQSPKITKDPPTTISIP